MMQGLFLTTIQVNQIFHCAWRDWQSTPPNNHLIGRSISFKFMFECQQLQAGHGMDEALFGPFIELLRADMDGKIIAAEADPHLNTLRVIEAHGICSLLVLPDAGVEYLAKHVFQKLNDWMYQRQISPRVIIRSIECGERDGTMGSYVGNL